MEHDIAEGNERAGQRQRKQNAHGKEGKKNVLDKESAEVKEKARDQE